MRIQIRSYTPLPAQRAFHESDAMFRAYIGGFGAGKTLAGCWEALDVSLAYPRNVGIIARKTYRELADSTQRTFLEICPPEVIANYSKREESLLLRNGSLILFRSLDDVEKFRSLNLGWAYIDEASEITDEEVPTKILGRLRLSHVPWRGMWVTSNPPHQEHWLYKWAVLRAAESPSRYFCVQASTYDNPHLPREYIEALEREYSPQWVARFLRGEFGHISPGSPVYDNFNESMHVADLEWDRDRPVYRSWDFGRHHPAVLFSQVGPDRQWRILREKMGTWVLLHDWAEQVVALSAEHYPGATFIDVGDPAGHQHGDKSERSSIEILRYEFGIHVRSRKIDKKRVIELINQRFAMVRNQPDGSTKPMIVIDRKNCPILIEAFAGGYSWPKGRDGRVRRDEPVEDGWFEHLIDCAHYTAAHVFLGGGDPGSGLKITVPVWRLS